MHATTPHHSHAEPPGSMPGGAPSAPAVRSGSVAPIVRSYLLSLAATRVTVRLRNGERGVLHGVNSSCQRAKVRIGNRFTRVPVSDLMYVIDPTDPEEA